MDLFAGVLGGSVMAILGSQAADRRRLSKRNEGLIAMVTFVVAAPLFASLPETASSPLISVLAITTIVMAIADPKAPVRLRTASRSTRFRIIMFGVAPAVVLTLFVSAALLFDVPRLPMILSGLAGLLLLSVLAAFLFRGNQKN